MSEQVRVVVVVDWPRQRVHGLTGSDAQAQQWIREIVANYPEGTLAATMTVGLVDSDAYERGRAAGTSMSDQFDRRDARLGWLEAVVLGAVVALTAVWVITA